MTSRHSQGPWMTQVDETPFTVESANATDPAICELLPRDADVYTEEDEANARLIAAAPDLLEACRRAVRLLEQRENVEPLVDSTLQQVRAAIAKAEAAA